MRVAVARRSFLAGLCSAVGAGFFAPAGAAEAVPAIAAAADLNYALKEVAEHFTKDTGKGVKLAFGSSGNFTTQIRQGGPFEVFLSADEEYVQTLTKEGKTDGEGAGDAICYLGVSPGRHHSVFARDGTTRSGSWDICTDPRDLAPAAAATHGAAEGRRRNRPSVLQLHADAAGARNPEALRLRAAG
jgi:hypothetical protein